MPEGREIERVNRVERHRHVEDAPAMSEAAGGARIGLRLDGAKEPYPNPSHQATYVIEQRIEFINQAMRAIRQCQKETLSLGEKIAIQEFIAAAAAKIHEMAAPNGPLGEELRRL